MSHLRIHCFQHVPFEGLGRIGNWIAQHGHSLAYTHFYETTAAIPPPDTYDWLIIMGGPMSIHDETGHPWLVAEKRAIRAAIDARKIVLGVCLGAQLIASVLGAKVTKNPEKEIGWLDISFEKISGGNLLEMYSGEATTKVFQWHGDTFEIPAGARKLASSSGCANQAFLYNERVLGLQFHFEVSAQGIRDMASPGTDELAIGGKYVQTEREVFDEVRYFQAANIRMFAILDKLAARAADFQLSEPLQRIYQKTIAFAAQRHGTQKLIGNDTPYIVHLANVAMEILFAARHTPDFNMRLALQLALLHDVLEDTSTTESELLPLFGAEVTAGVKALTKNTTLPKTDRMTDSLRRILGQPKEVWSVKMADRITNLQPPPPQWSAEKVAEYKAEAIVIYDTLNAGNTYLAVRLKTVIENYPNAK